VAVEVQTLPGLLPTHDQVVDAVLLSDVVQGAGCPNNTYRRFIVNGH